MEQGGIEAWSRVSVAEKSWVRADAEHYTKSTDILEVWFDSAPPSSTCCAAATRTPTRVLPYHAEGPEADLYLEGHDQHRGWFHSRCCWACALYDRAPYRGC